MKLPLAHQTWFAVDDFPASWSFVTQTLTLVLLAVAVLATFAARRVPRGIDGIDVPLLARTVPWMPFAVRMHLGVSLVGLLSLGAYLSPAMDLQPDLPGILLGVVMAVVAVGMVTGWHTREVALLLIAAGPLGMLEFGLLPVLQRIDVLGLAVFVLLTGPGRWSADLELGRVREATRLDLARAVWALRVGVGVALIVVASVEKLASPEYAVAFLAEHQEINVAAQLGVGWSDLEFVRVAGCIEVLFGLMLISGAVPQLVVLSVGIPFNATLWFFGTNELLGHLPVYGALLVLLACGSDPELRPLVRAAWPWSGPGDPRGTFAPQVAS